MEVNNTKQQLTVNNACIDSSSFTNVSLKDALFSNIYMGGAKITDANLSNLEIDGAQLGGAYIHNIGMPPVGHPMYDPQAKQAPLKFENCELEGSSFTACSFKNVTLTRCQVEGMTVDGVSIEELLRRKA